MARVEEADELYGLPLDEFVPARTALTRRLRKEGRKDDAAEVGGLRKPSVALWAVNQLARRRPAELERLLDAAERLRAGDAGVDEELRRAVAELVRAAGPVLEEGGHAASDATVQRVATTLRAAAASGGEEREALARGALDRELEPAGFEAMAALAASRPAASARPAKESTRAAREAEGRRDRIDEAERALSDARARDRDARAEAERLEQEAGRARQEADRAAADVEKAQQALERARARVSD